MMQKVQARWQPSEICRYAEGPGVRRVAVPGAMASTPSRRPKVRASAPSSDTVTNASTSGISEASSSP